MKHQKPMTQGKKRSIMHERTAVPVSELKVGMFVSELDRPWEETPFLLQGFTIRNAEDIAEIANHCDFVYVENMAEVWEAVSDKRRMQRATRNSEPVIPTKQEYRRAESAYQNTRSLTKSLMDEVALGKGINVKEVKKSVSDCVQSVVRNPDTMMWMARMRDEDAYTTEHCLNVGLLAIVFGRHLGLSEQDLEYLGFAGVVHDVGKMKTPKEILNKPGALTKEEFKIMQQHTTDGRNILISQKNIMPHAVDIAFGHHEHLDGSGYPRGVKGNAITPFTRIITLCDIYDAITSDRVYKKGRPSTDALNILYRGRGVKFDQKLTEAFIRCIGLYPLGSVVELRSGEIAVVISVNREQKRLPKVMVVRGADKKLCQQRVVDLKREAGEGRAANVITSILPNGSHGVRIESLIEEGLVLA
jgi:putative nucleotidyltransferase with HDIG domain